jgi:hypothetical protein
MQSPETTALGDKICQQLATEISKFVFPETQQPAAPVFNQAQFNTAKDPYSGLDSLIGIWRGAHGQFLGEIKLHSDGSFYAEYVIALPHPSNKRWFVEAVTAWGRDDVIKSEPKLLPSLE